VLEMPTGFSDDWGENARDSFSESIRSEAVKKSKIHRKDAKVQRNRKVKTLFEIAFFASPLPRLCGGG
jgi:hypothetical protein